MVFLCHEIHLVPKAIIQAEPWTGQEDGVGGGEGHHVLEEYLERGGSNPTLCPNSSLCASHFYTYQPEW